MSGGFSRWRLGLVVAAIFAAGLATGLALPPVLHRPPPFGPPGGPPPWLRELELSEPQRAAAESIFQRHRADVDAIMREALPKVRARTEAMEQELKALLTPSQVARLEAIRARRPPPPPPGGPGGPGSMFDGPPPPLPPEGRPGAPP